MRFFVVCLLLLAPMLVLGAGCDSENRTQKPKEGVVDTSDPSKLVIPDQMKKNAPIKPAAPKK